MMLRSHVVGSLLRPSYLIEAREQLEAGTIGAHEFKRAEDKAVGEAIDLQEAAGLDMLTDGEMRRFLFTGSLTEAVSGIAPIDSETLTGDPAQWHGDEVEGEFRSASQAVAITDRLRRVRSLATEEYTFARSRTEIPIKVTLPSPIMLLTFWSQEHSTAAYPSAMDAFEHAAEILRQEIHELAQLGCEQVQIDAPEFTAPVDPSTTYYYEDAGISTDTLLTDCVDILNSVTGEPGVTFSTHLCRGNNQGRWMSAGGYEAISKQVFPRLTGFQNILLEYDDERSGSFDALRDMPDDKCVVLGLVTTRNAEPEDRDLLQGRIDEAGRIYPLEQLAVSTQCGFASVLYGNPISQADQAAKLRLVAELARDVWGEG